MSPIRPSKHATLLAQLPLAGQGPDALREAGYPDVAHAVQHVLDYARTTAQAQVDAAAARPATTNRPLQVTREFRAAVHRIAQAEGASIPTIVRKSLEDFVDGIWTPPARPRARRGTAPDKVMINVAVPDNLWNEANRLGKEQATERGYALTAASVAITALEQFALPESDQQDATA